MSEFKVITGAMWALFNEIQGPIPIIWMPKDLSEEILFTVSLRTMAVFSSEIRKVPKMALLSVIPFPEFNLYSFSDIIVQFDEKDPHKGQLHLISIFIPSELIASPWIDFPQVQSIFQKYLESYRHEPVPNMKEVLLNYIANDIDRILYHKKEGERLKNHLTNYLNSYFFSILSYDEALLLQARIDIILELLDRVLKAGDLEKIERSLRRLTFLLEQELQDELVYTYLKTSSSL